MLRVLFLFVFLSGCGWFREEPVVVIPFVPGCTQFMALAQAVVEGRRQGQSRAEQRLLVLDATPTAPIHRAMVESIYDWPRPTTARDWQALTEVSVFAAETRCQNRPAAALRGQVVP